MGGSVALLVECGMSVRLGWRPGEIVDPPRARRFFSFVMLFGVLISVRLGLHKVGPTPTISPIPPMPRSRKRGAPAKAATLCSEWRADGKAETSVSLGDSCLYTVKSTALSSFKHVKLLNPFSWLAI